MDPIKVSMTSLDNMKHDKNAVMMGGMGDMSVDAIPDLDILTGKVFEILTFLEDPKTKKLMKTNDSAVKMMLNNKYTDVPLGIITLLLDENTRSDNVDRLLRMFENLNSAKAGTKNIEDIQTDLIEEVNEKYLYSKYGGKKKFEEVLSKEVSKKK